MSVLLIVVGLVVLGVVLTHLAGPAWWTERRSIRHHEHAMDVLRSMAGHPSGDESAEAEVGAWSSRAVGSPEGDTAPPLGLPSNARPAESAGRADEAFRVLGVEGRPSVLPEPLQVDAPMRRARTPEPLPPPRTPLSSDPPVVPSLVAFRSPGIEDPVGSESGEAGSAPVVQGEEARTTPDLVFLADGAPLSMEEAAPAPSAAGRLLGRAGALMASAHVRPRYATVGLVLALVLAGGVFTGLHASNGHTENVKSSRFVAPSPPPSPPAPTPPPATTPPPPAGAPTGPPATSDVSSGSSTSTAAVVPSPPTITSPPTTEIIVVPDNSTFSDTPPMIMTSPDGSAPAGNPGNPPGSFRGWQMSTAPSDTSP